MHYPLPKDGRMVESSFNFIGTGNFTSPNESASIDVVFVHGLGGNPIKTWASGDDPADFWPGWLAQDFERINVWTAGYDSAVFAGVLAGEGGSLADFSSIIRDFLLSKGLQKRRIIFITHSLGGLLIKQMLRRCCDSIDPKCKELLAAVTGVIFIGTPHQGAGVASIVCSILNHFASRQIRQLALNDDHLNDLGNWFRNWACGRRLRVAAYYEIDKTTGIHIVNKVTADPNVPGCEPVAIKANHIQICKPDTHDSQLYTSITALLRELLVSATSSATLASLPAVPASATALVPVQSAASIPVPSTSLVPMANLDAAQMTMSAIAAGQLAKELSCTEAMPLTPELLVDYEYFTTEAPHDRRPLDQKLRDGGRAREVNDAKRKKERFAMSLRRHSAQASSLGRYTRLMSDVESRFQRHVQASINAGVPTEEVNRLVQEAVIDPALKLQLSETEDATASLVESALFYLTGNCHVRWDSDEN
jgi:protein SERAC1